jgi:hypothetical protein
MEADVACCKQEFLKRDREKENPSRQSISWPRTKPNGASIFKMSAGHYATICMRSLK